MGLKSLLERKRSELENRKAGIAELEDEVNTLEKAFSIAEKAGEKLDGSTSTARTPLVRRVRSERKRKLTERKPKPKGRSLADATRDAIGQLAPPFTTGQVREWIHRSEPGFLDGTNATSLASTLRRMGEKGELEVVEKGGPGKEATYRPSVKNPASIVAEIT